MLFNYVKVLGVNAISQMGQELGEQVATYELQGGTQVKVFVNDLNIHLRACPPPGMDGSWQMPKLTLHWGYTEKGSDSWKVQGVGQSPPGTHRRL